MFFHPYLLIYFLPVQEILSGISVCIEGVSRTALKQKEFQDDSTLMQMLDWVGWVCEQMDDLGEEDF